MPKRLSLDYRQMEAGYEFPPVDYTLEPSLVATYLKAVEETSQLYLNAELVPPTAIATYALAALSESVAFPPGTIHVNQELEFIATVSAKDTITCYAKVSRKQDRARLHLLTIDLKVVNQNQQKVLSGKIGFVLPEHDNNGR